MTAPLPLTGIRVLDFTHVLAGPYCTWLLATLGAEVIKVERPDGGDLLRGIGSDAQLNGQRLGDAFLSVNAGKRFLALDLKSEAGREVVRDLARSADVVVESFRPGVLDGLGIGHEALQADNPRLVYCAISGFGQDGPMRETRAFDHVMQAVSGIMAATGEPDGRPQKVGFPVTDNSTGMTAAFAIVSALLERHSSGRGRFIDVAMQETAYGLMASQVLTTLMSGEPPPRVGNSAFTGSPSADCFATGEGELLIGANTGTHYQRLLDALDLGTLREDARFASLEAAAGHRAALRERLEQALAARSALDWEVRLRDAGVPASAVRDLAQSLDAPHARARDLARSLPLADLDARPLPLPGAPFKLDGERPQCRAAPRRVGADSRAVLTELGYSPQRIEALLADAEGGG